tara:strand:+ start:174 stop:1100 length:927 start_codon:yes stop_codon:yes gene_type:complete
MKLAYFDNFQLGILTDKGLVNVSHIIMDIPHTNPGNLMNGLIENFENYRSKLETAAEKGVAFPLDSIKIQPPLPKPGAIDCMAVNYMENGTLKEKPQINGFHKSPSAIIGNGDTMILPDVPATIFEGEAELGLIIGKRASNVSESDAMDHVFGYLNFIDGSARGLPPDRNVFFQVKSRATFAPIGPFIVTADEIPDPQNLSVKLWVNGELKQDFNTNDMAHKIPKAISWLSSIHALEPGDLIATGTNHRGLSSFQHGDKIELEVEMLGRLSINVQDDLRRTWGRETRLDRKNAGYETPTPQLTGKYAK